MPEIGKWWRHVIFHVRGAWLPGDPRGFRSRRHEIHSSGDYKNPPPEGEHRGLRRYHQARSERVVKMAENLRKVIGAAVVWVLQKEGYRVLVTSVGATHVHVLAELPVDLGEVHAVVGRCKAKASWAVGIICPRLRWAGGGSFKWVRDREHQMEVYRYILEKQGTDAWTWNFRNAAPEKPKRWKTMPPQAE